MRHTLSVRVRALMTVVVLLAGVLPLTGCNGMTDEEFLDLAKAKLLEFLSQNSEDAEEPEDGPVNLALTYPVGRSPRVFVTGWVFGVSCTATDADGDSVDLSQEVTWSGTGTFTPTTGARSRPTFAGEGTNTITLSVEYEGKTYTRDFAIEAVSSATYARQGDVAKCAADSHGGPADPLTVVGPIISGSPNVFIDGRPAARQGDAGIHAACSGENSYTISGGDPEVLINGRPAAKIGSETRHCGGVGSIIQGGSGG